MIFIFSTRADDGIFVKGSKVLLLKAKVFPQKLSGLEMLLKDIQTRDERKIVAQLEVFRTGRRGESSQQF